MSKKLILTENQLKTILDFVVKEQIDTSINEYGVKGMYKSKWTKEDFILTMYVARYGYNALHISPKDLAENIIGSSKASLVQQVSNFNHLDGKGGFDRPHPLESSVWEEFKDVKEQDHRKICMEIINRIGNTPKPHMTKIKLGRDIGDTRERVAKDRESALSKIGKDPSKFKLIGTKNKEKPVEDDPDEEIKVQTPKDSVLDYLNDVNKFIDSSGDSNPTELLLKIKDYISFIISVVDEDLISKESAGNINEQENEDYSEPTSKDTVISMLKAMNSDLQRANSGNFSHMAANLRGGLLYLIELVSDDLVDKPQEGM